VSLFSVYGARPGRRPAVRAAVDGQRLVGEGDGNEARTAIVVALVFNAGSFGSAP
jgi:dTMP kinase